MKDESRRERPTRREVLLGAGAFGLMQAGVARAFGEQPSTVPASPKLPHARPPVADRKFTSPVVEDAIATLQRQIADPALRVLV